ncbi:MAG TPA: sulfatase-like hydrolase/transferase [Isosphaeraceae bacterium]|nr:sulfatase-like hydrolase/transferase [Isosphaeraceae bacterium]
MAVNHGNPKHGSLGSGPTLVGLNRPGPWDVLAMAAACGLAAGWLEVGTRVLCRAIHPTGRLYMMSRHFVWLVPLANLLLFFGVGLFLAVLTKVGGRPGSWLCPRLLTAAAILPALLVAGPGVYPWAWLLLAWGIALRLVPWLERSARRWLTVSLAAMLGFVPVVAGLVFGGDWLKQRRETSRPLPPANSPNVLLIVLDTVRADHLSLYGYPRATSRTLDRLAQRGIRFDEARATAPWTLPSHASLFTGRWPHELDVQWVTPLRGQFPTLAAYLGSRGYATAGFVANTEYCSSDTGLDRGFTHYEDYVLDFAHLRPVRTATLVERGWTAVATLSLLLRDRLTPGQPLHARVQSLIQWLLAPSRKDAGSINREFLDWLANRPEPGRPFFAFLNYFDAHTPYLPPEGAGFRFGPGPRTLADYTLLVEQWKTIDKASLIPHFRELVRDSYDNCLAYLDDRLAELFETLHRLGVLDRTVVIVTADHGEELGEHKLFEHGESLYRPEIRVPLVIVVPAGSQGPGVVPETVSLRDLPATIVDLTGLGANSPFPGRSLTRLWRAPSPAAAGEDCDDEGVISELTAPNPTNPSLGRSPAARGPLSSLAEGDYVYIRSEKDGRELLFHEHDDPDELVNRARIEGMQPILERLRQRLDRIKPRNYR